MTIIEWFKLLWPVAVVVLGFAIRLEVGQSLNKWRHRELEKDIGQLKDSVDKDIAGMHSRMSRHETQTNSYLSEIRNDIKTLLARDK